MLKTNSKLTKVAEPKNQIEFYKKVDKKGPFSCNLLTSFDSGTSELNSPINSERMNANFVAFKAKVIGIQALKSGPANTSAILFNLPRDAEVNVIAERIFNSNEHWYQINFKRRTGWLCKD